MTIHTECKNFTGGESPKCAVYDFYFCLDKICKYYNKSLDSQEVKDFKYIYDIVNGQQVNFFN